MPNLFNNKALPGSAVQEYTVDRSLRFRSSASAYLSRTPASSPTSAQIFTQSFWVKRGSLGVYNYLYNCEPSDWSRIYFFTDDYLYFDLRISGTNYSVQPSQVFRDPASWYHIVYAVDTTQATASDRVKIYINGSQVTSFGAANYPPQNSSTLTNSANAQYIGSYKTPANFFDGYLTEINFIDGQAIDPTYFGKYNPNTGVWQPINYAGTYGTNGFYLNFSDNSTTTTLGYDTSGNGNNWTTNNISVTSGATYDSMLDVPTLTSTDVANYATLNPLGVNTPSGVTLNGNLTLSNSTSNQKRATIPVVSTDTNKYYWEATVNGTASSNFPMHGMYVVGAGTYWPGYDGNSIGLYQGGSLVYNGSIVATLTSYADGDVISIAFDPSTGKIWFAKNGTWYASGDPATGTSPNYTLPTGVDRVAGGYTGSGYGTLEFNFGQRPFAYTPPAGFKSLNTYNLPDSTIKDGSRYFNTVLATGNASTQSITGVGFQPDFVWLKVRSAAVNHISYDAVRGADNYLVPNLANAEASGGGQGLTSFDTDGFTLGSINPNSSGSYTFVAWNWKANGSGVSNTDGSITSTVSANPTAGFSIVSYTGNGSASATVGHGLGSSADMIILKDRDVAGNNWRVWHKDLTANYWMYLNLTNTEAANATDGGIRNVDSSTFGFINGTTAGVEAVNRNNGGFIAYCFAEVEGYSKFGKYTGNGSANGTFVYTGFRPAFVIVKGSSSVTNWHMVDSVRDVDNPAENYLLPNLANAEATADIVDCLSNGFKLRNSAISINASGGTYIYMAFAENPFKNSLAR